MRRRPDVNLHTLRAIPMLTAGLILSGAAMAASPPTAVVGGHIIPVDGPEIEDGTLIFTDGQITAVGPRDKVKVPAGARIIDGSGRVLMPGLVDTHSHIGGASGADRSAPIQPGVRLLDAINVRGAAFMRARAGGVTTANLMPGSGHLMSGQTVYAKLRHGNTVDELLIIDADGNMMGGMKMANGTNSRRDPPFPGTRAKSAALVREQFVKAQAYREKLETADGDKKPDRDLDMEALVEVLDGRRMVHHHTHRHDDVMTVLRLADEFGFRVVLHHVSEGWKVADEIAAAGVGASIILVDSPGGKLEARDLLFETGAILEQAGVPVAFHTDDWITDSRLFLRSPALAVRAGMSREGALAAVTLTAAGMMDLEDRIGSLKAGKDADFIILSGDPFSVTTRILQTWVEGEKVFDLDDPDDRPFAVGGYGAGEPQAGHLHEVSEGEWGS
jgi:imidazolonepropionase-like amidohydrolase